MIRKAGARDSNIVAEMAAQLLSELSGNPVGIKPLLGIAKVLLASESSHFTVLLAYPGDDPSRYVGLLTIAEVSALYACGSFGVIQEFYVAPAERSKGIGHLLLKEAINHGRQCGWSRIEVGAPDLPKWVRTVDFYRREGFQEIGPRLKLAL